MQGCGNDYIYIEATALSAGEDPAALSRQISDRHYGVGSDGLVIVGREGEALTMRIFNADGSEAEMCGNASRCVGRYALRHGWWDGQQPIALLTRAGEKTLVCDVQGNIEVNIGRATLRAIVVEGQSASAVEVGNPHCIFFVNDITAVRLEEQGRAVENNTALFPARTNVEYAEIEDLHTIRLLVWERGSGATLACGTGATATAYAAVETGRCSWPVTLHMPGGDLTVNSRTGELWLGGSAESVFTGEWRVES